MLVHHGSCPVIQSGNVAVPFLEMQSEASDRFYTSSVNLTRSSCENGFLDTYSSTGGTASDWSDGLCLGVTTKMCLAESSTTELVRIVVHFSGSLTTSASLHVDGKPVAWMEKQRWQERGVVSTTDTIDTILLLSGGCRTLLVVYDDGISSPAGQQDPDYMQSVRIPNAAAFSRHHFIALAEWLQTRWNRKPQYN